MGRKAHEPTKEYRLTVRALCLAGYTQKEVAAVLEISSTTLKKYYKRELKAARMMATARVAKSLLNSALSGSVPAQIFWMKTQGPRGEWLEKKETDEDLGAKKNPYAINITLNKDGDAES